MLILAIIDTRTVKTILDTRLRKRGNTIANITLGTTMATKRIAAIGNGVKMKPIGNRKVSAAITKNAASDR